MVSPVDPFTAASPTYRAAIRHPYKSGSAFEVSKPLSLCGEIATGVIVVAVLLGSGVACLWLAAAISSLNGGN